MLSKPVIISAIRRAVDKAPQPENSPDEQAMDESRLMEELTALEEDLASAETAGERAKIRRAMSLLLKNHG